MLLSLHIKNIALIDETEIEFDKGLNVLSGETGAGKSILIDSVNFALGARMPKDIARDESKPALCELVFSVDDDVTRKKLSELDIELEDETIILSRKIANGKSSIKCNGESITSAAAKAIASCLIDIHGQHEHQSLLNAENHRKILDEYCGDDFAKLKDEYKTVYTDYKKAVEEYEKAKESASGKDQDGDYCAFVVNEIENANLSIGEDEDLEQQYSKMNSSKKIAESIMAVKEYLEDEEAGAAVNISRATGYLKSALSLDDELSELYSQLMDIDSLLSDFSRGISDYEDSLVFSPEDYARCEERLNEINRLKVKYAPTIEGILAHQKQMQDKLDMISDYDSYLEKLNNRVDELYNKIVGLCKAMSDIRKEESLKLSEDIRQSLHGLNFLDAAFTINIESSEEKITSNGYDTVEFLISTNPGEKLKPLTMVASGGELSRIMLSLKAVFAGKDEIGTLIFDEIDTGISGKTADLVAFKMDYIANMHQVICVTHLPQIASHAYAHFLIEKSVNEGRTVTSVSRLSEEESVLELARMLSGSEITEATIANAREMKKSIKEK